MNLRSTTILTVSLPIHEPGVSFYLFRSCLISFSDVLRVFSVHIFYLYCYIYSCFISFDAAINDIVFLASNSHSLLLVYRNILIFVC